MAWVKVRSDQKCFGPENLVNVENWWRRYYQICCTASSFFFLTTRNHTINATHEWSKNSGLILVKVICRTMNHLELQAIIIDAISNMLPGVRRFLHFFLPFGSSLLWNIWINTHLKRRGHSMWKKNLPSIKGIYPPPARILKSDKYPYRSIINIIQTQSHTPTHLRTLSPHNLSYLHRFYIRRYLSCIGRWSWIKIIEFTKSLSKCIDIADVKAVIFYLFLSIQNIPIHILYICA